ncbi:MAG TPA: hypothetical protein VFP84_31790 [Kofleriaceae bacterium]|nr:hypothetical protein [Kofleriaceae bacterium]
MRAGDRGASADAARRARARHAAPTERAGRNRRRTRPARAACVAVEKQFFATAREAARAGDDHDVGAADEQAGLGHAPCGHHRCSARFATPDEIAAGIVFVASAAARGITGSSTRVDGGVVRSIG